MNVNQQGIFPAPPSLRRRSASPTRSRTQRMATWAVALALVGCSSVPLASLWALRQLDFWTLDPSQVHAMALLPVGVGAQPEAVKLTLKAQRGGGSAEVAEEHLALRATPAQQTPPAPTPAGARWLPLAFDEADTARFNAFRTRLQAWKAADGKVADRNFNLSVVPALCSSGAVGVETKQVVLSAWLRWQPGQELLAVLDGASLKDVAEKTKLPARLPACN